MDNIETPEENDKMIGSIGNYYGGLHVKKENNKCYWAIEDVEGLSASDWEEIPPYLYDTLLTFEAQRNKD